MTAGGCQEILIRGDDGGVSLSLLRRHGGLPAAITTGVTEQPLP